MQLFTFFTRPTSGLKSIILVLGVLLGVNGVMGQTTVTVGGGASITCPATPTATWTTPPSGVTFSNWSRGSGVTCGSAGDGISGSVFNASSAANGYSANSFFQVTITAGATTNFTLSSITWLSTVSSGSANFTIQYSNNGGALTTFGTGGATGTGSSISNTFTPGTAVSVAAGTSIVVYLIPYGTNASGRTVRFKNGSTFTVTASSASPTISTSGTLAAVNTTYGAASASPTSFTLSGTNMTAGILVTPPSTNFEVSTTVGSGYADNITVGAAGTIASTTVYLRLKPTATVSGSPYAGNIVLSSSGATSVNVATVSSTVSPKALTITGLTASNKNYDGNTTVTVSGTPTYVGLSNGESHTVTGTVDWVFADANVGANKTLTRNGSYNAPNINYSLTQPTLTASIIAIVPSAPNNVSITPGNTILGVDFTAPTSNGGATITNYEYSLNNGTSWNTPNPVVTTAPLTITGLTNGTQYEVRLRAVNSVGSGDPSTMVNGTPSAPAAPTVTIVPTLLTAPLTTTYGTASSVLSFEVSGTLLLNDIVVAAPAGLEVSLSNNSGFGNSVTLNQNSGTVVGTLVYVRLKADAAVTGNYDNVSITASSIPANPESITTTASGNLVNAKALTITGLTANGKTYDGTNTVSVIGTPSYDGLIAGESFTVSGTPTFAFTTVSAGINKAITQTGNYSAPSGNYTLTQPTLTATIAQAPLTITAAAQSKNFGTTSPTTGTDATTFTSSGLIASETIGSVTLGYSGSPAGNLVTAIAGSYTITPSAATGGSFTAANYSITYNTGSLTINAIQASAPTAIVITATSTQLSVAFTAASNGGSPITDYQYSINGGTSFTSAGTTSSPIVITGLVNGTTYPVQIRAVTAFGNGVATGSTAGTPTNTILWSNTGGAAWLTASNWTGNAVPTGLQVAQFGANPTAATGVGINFNGTTNAGTQTNGQKIQEVGAIELTSARAAAHLIGNSSTTVGATGQFRLNSAAVNGIENTIIRNNSSQNLTIQNTQNTGTQTMTVILGGSTNNIVNVDGTGNIVISSIISGGNPLTKAGSGSGVLTLSAGNTYTGKTFINTGFINATGESAFGANPGSFIADQITLNGGGIQASSGNIDFNSNRGITLGASGGTFDVATTRTITLTNVTTGAGTLTKTGLGTLTMAGAHTLSGGTTINNGTITVNSGSSIGTGALSMAQTSSNTTSLTLNNAAQSIGTLSSAWTASTGTIAQTITLNGTALTINQAADATYGTGTDATLTSIITGTGSVVKSGSGILTFTSANTYTGTTTINNGTLRLGAANVLANSTNIVLGGGTFSTGATTGFSETVGTLNLSQNSTIALGTGNHTITFAASNAVTWNGSTLTITGWTGTAGATGTSGKIFFASNTSLNAGQLAKINFDGYNGGAALLGTGELVPINPPQITGTATTAVFTSTYGSNSSIQEFAIDGVNLIAHIYVTAPSNFEVATDGRTFSSSAEFIPSNGIVNGTLSVRLATTAAIDGAYNSQNIVLTSTGATTVNITTPASGNGVRPTTLVVTGSTVCSSATGSVTSDGSLPGVSYQLYTAAGTPVQVPQSDLNGAAITWTGLTSGVSYYVVGTSPASSSSLTSANSNYAAVNVATGYTWTGNAGDNDQSNSANWQCGAVPDNNAPPVSVTVNGFLMVTGSDFQAADLTIASGASVLLADGKLKISGYVIGDNGAIDATAGTVVFNKTSDNVILGNVFYNNTIHNLQIEGNASIDGAINLTGELSIVGNNIELNADNSLYLISNETGTARVADLTAGGTQTGNSIRGIVNAQRYIPLNTLGASRTGRAWRLMSIPLEGNSALNTVRLAFAGTAPNPNASAEESNGIGTLISGPGSLNTSGAAAAARGFDYWNGLNTSTASSIRKFTTTSAGAGWTETPMDIHTTLLDNAEQGYMLFIRGDRGIRNVNDPLQTQPASATSFSAYGSLKYGEKDVIIPSSSTAAFAVLGNPYFAPLNFESVVNDVANSNIIDSDNFYLWDANLPGTNGNGGYRLITKLSAGVWEDASDAIFTGSNPDLELIQPWQAIIVIPDAGGTLTIKEQHKQGNPGSTPQPFDPIVAAPQPWLRAGLYYNEAKSSSRIDGTAVAFGVTDTIQVAAINPFGSSLSINMRKAGSTLKAEKRGFFQTTDTVHFVTNGLTARKFVLQLQADALVQPGGTMELVDKYTNTRTTLVSGTTTEYVFTPVAGIAASLAADRLMVVLRQPVFVPATFVNVSATTANNGHLINWTTTNEQHIQRYEVEYSSNGTQFAKLENKNALKGNTNNYQHTVANPAVADAYYRIKAIGYNGDVQYSNRVWLKEASISGSEVKLYPNPVKGQQVNIELSRLAQGNYQIVLVNAVGQQVMSRTVSHIGGTATQTLPTGSLSAGLYELQVYQNDTLVARQKMSVAVGK